MNSLEKQRLIASPSPEQLEKQEERRLALLASRWYYKPVRVTTLNVPADMLFYSQEKYEDIPLREANKDDSSTVASKGSAIMVAKFCGDYFKSYKQFTVEELANMATELGYIHYEKKGNGRWEDNKGIRPEFFDRFVPALYGLFSSRAKDINDVSSAIENKKLVIFQVRDSLNKDFATSRDSHYLIVVGDNSTGFFIYDSMYTSIQHMRHDRVFKALKEAWIIYGF